MDIHNEILNGINTRYALFEKGDQCVIIDIYRRTMVIIDDPVINLTELIKLMKGKGAKIFKNLDDLPKPAEPYISNKLFPQSYKLFINRIFDHKGNETGAIISALTNKLINASEKQFIEGRIENYAFTVLYPGEGLNVYSSVYQDTASLTIIKGINNLPSKDINMEEREINNR